MVLSAVAVRCPTFYVVSTGERPVSRRSDGKKKLSILRSSRVIQAFTKGKEHSTLFPQHLTRTNPDKESE